MRKLRGFTLIEIMIVVGVIIVLAVIGIPSILRTRQNAQESAALSALSSIAKAIHTYRVDHTAYPANLAVLGTPLSQPPYIDSTLACAEANNPPYTCERGSFYFKLTGSTNTFTATAEAYGWSSGANVKKFQADESGVIRYNVGGSSGWFVLE